MSAAVRVEDTPIEAELLRRYREPHRRYHDETHVRHVLATVDELAGIEDVMVVRLAAWFHDAVYDPRRHDNEDRSADLATELLTGAGADPAVVAEAGRLIRLTAGHDPAPGDAEGALLCDADLSVLGADPAGYRRYARAVRAEYAHVDDAAFRAGRAAVLRTLLDRPALFRTPQGKQRYEQTARANVTAELAALDEGGADRRR